MSPISSLTHGENFIGIDPVVVRHFLRNKKMTHGLENMRLTFWTHDMGMQRTEMTNFDADKGWGIQKVSHSPRGKKVIKRMTKCDIGGRVLS